ncbi:hypothetical protein EMIT053CA3_40220 [Pseudomonas donghuensis]
MDLCTPDLWELALPAIERAAVVIQTPPDVLAVPAPSLASQLRTPNLWELALPAIEREAVVIQAPPDELAVLAPSLASQLPQWICVRRTCGSGSCPRSSAQRS